MYMSMTLVNQGCSYKLGIFTQRKFIKSGNFTQLCYQVDTGHLTEPALPFWL